MSISIVLTHADSSTTNLSAYFAVTEGDFAPGLSVKESIEAGGATFSLWDTGSLGAIKRTDVVAITDSSGLSFTGWVRKVSVDYQPIVTPEGTMVRFLTVTCVDKGSILDQRSLPGSTAYTIQLPPGWTPPTGPAVPWPLSIGPYQFVVSDGREFLEYCLDGTGITIHADSDTSVWDGGTYSASGYVTVRSFLDAHKKPGVYGFVTSDGYYLTGQLSSAGTTAAADLILAGVTPVTTVSGALTMLFPGGTSYSHTAPYTLSYAPDMTASVPYQNLHIDVDWSGWADWVYVSAATGPHISVDEAVSSVAPGASQWVGADAAFGPSREANVSSGASTPSGGLADGTLALTRSQTPAVTGTVEVLGYTGFRAGSVLDIVHPFYALPSLFITEVETTYVDPSGQRLSRITFGNAPLGSLQLRERVKEQEEQRTDDIRATGSSRQAATRHSLVVSDVAPQPGSTIDIKTQLTNSREEPWRIAGKTVDWTLVAFDRNANDVTSTSGAYVSPSSSTTDANGIATTRLTVGSGSGIKYVVSASTPDT